MSRILAWGLMVALAIGTAAPSIEAMATACEQSAKSVGATPGSRPVPSSCCCAPSNAGACGAAPAPVTTPSGACCQIAIPARPSAGIVPVVPEPPTLRGQASLVPVQPVIPVMPVIGSGDQFFDASSPPPSPARPLYSRIALLLI